MPDSSSPPVPGLDDALDELYGVDPDEFVDTRKRLAGALRATGEKDAAKQVQSARRPTVAAWTLNQLRRREELRLQEFLLRSRELRDASRDDIRAALAAQRDAFNALTSAAMNLLGDRANDSYRAQITATLHAATADESVAAQVEQGRLIREIADVGFPMTGTIAVEREPTRPVAKAKERPRPELKVVPDLPAAPRTGSGPEPEPEPDEEQLRRDAERRRVDEALRTAEEAAEAAARHRDETQGEAERLATELDDARQVARAAAEAARSAKREVDRLTKARARLP